MYQLKNGWTQMCDSKSCGGHFSSGWNVNDAIWLIICPIIVIASMPSETMIDQEVLIVMSSFATFTMLIKLFDWMRLFCPFNVYLILTTVKRIAEFMYLMIIGLLICGVPMVMLNIIRIINDQDQVINEVSSKWWLPNLIINQYTLALGEF